MENTLKVLTSDKFAVEHTASLSLFLYPSSLLVFAKDKNQSIVAIHQYKDFNPKKLESLLASDSLTKMDLPAKVYLHEGLFTLLPGVLYLQGKETDYLQLAGKLPEHPHFFQTPVDSNNIQILSCIPAKLYKQLSNKFSELSLFHGAGSFLSYLFKERFNLIGQEIWINLFGSNMYVAGFNDQELAVFTRMDVHTKEDVLKYLLIYMETLQHDRNHARVTLFGAAEQAGITEAWGKNYVANFRLLHPPANQNYPSGFSKEKFEGVFECFWHYQNA